MSKIKILIVEDDEDINFIYYYEQFRQNVEFNKIFYCSRIQHNFHIRKKNMINMDMEITKINMCKKIKI